MDILTVKVPLIGRRLSNSDKEPLFSMERDKLDYLASFAKMVETWCKAKENYLTQETSKAIIQTTGSLLALSIYLFNHGFNYVLLGKIQ